MATAPQVDYCLVCDDLRMEIGNKVTLLGYYGMLPRVKILLRQWGAPIPRLIFLISTHGADTPYDTRIKLINPDGSDLVEAGSIMGDPAATAGDNSVVGFGFMPMTFTQKGLHRAQVSIDGAKAYENTFLVGAQDSASVINAGRNEPCPCGSGKKFKKCHGAPQP